MNAMRAAERNRQEAQSKPGGPSDISREREPTLSGDTPRMQSHAAAMMGINEQRAAGVLNRVRMRPITAIILFAVLFLIGWVAYVYLAINSPAVLHRFTNFSSTTRPPATISPSSRPTLPLTTITPRPTPLPEPEAAIPLSKKPEASTMATSAPAKSGVEAPNKAVEPTLQRKQPQRDINIAPNTLDAPPSSVLVQAYQALQNNNLEQASKLYQRLLAQEPDNTDALLGLAAIATQQKKIEQAGQYYMRVLDLDPKHALAQAGMINLYGKAEPQESETHLKQLIAREPSPLLYFTLGNLYAEQNQWTAAQQAYFQAYHMQPNNADYAFNLAIGLDHLNQPKLALNYYQKAQQLAVTSKQYHFDITLVNQRVYELQKLVE